MGESEYDVICAVVVGKLGESEGLKERERKTDRKPSKQIAFEVTS